MFYGRLGRLHFVSWFIILLGISIVVLGTFGGFLARLPMGKELLWLISFAFMILNVQLFVRRLHDAGYSGNWVLITFLPIFVPIPVFGLLVTLGMPLVLAILPPSSGDNGYGPPPGKRTLAQAFFNS